MARSMTHLVSLALLLSVTTPAFAQEYGREGFSVGAGISGAFEDFDDDGIGFDNTAALNAFAGYRFHPNFGVEARFEQTGDFEGDVGPIDVDVSIWTLTANAQFFVLTDQFQPYVIGGVGIAEAEVDVSPGGDDSEDDAVWRLGVGMDSYVTPNFVIGVEAAYNFGVDDLDDLDYWTLSALFRYRF